MTGEERRPNQELYAACDRFVMLMERAADTIDRQALDQVDSLKGQVESLTSEMETLFQSALADSLAPEATAQLKQLILQALERLTLNQTRLTGWLNETGAELGQLQQGAVAVQSYGATVRSGLPLFEQQA
jgi:chromosome condensin MukBEF MukE localization factor